MKDAGVGAILKAAENHPNLQLLSLEVCTNSCIMILLQIMYICRELVFRKKKENINQTFFLV